MRKILLTGATGFIGANLARALENENEVHVLLRKKSNTWRINSLKKIKKHYVDLSNLKKLKDIIEKINPHAIIHCATFGGLPEQNDETTIFRTNFDYFRNLLEASSNVNYNCFINTGSSSEYGPKTDAMVEADILEPRTAYGISKAAATLYASFYAKTKNKPIITIRPFSPYGYFEEKKRLIPSVILNCINRETIKIGNPNSVRDFVFIEDVAELYKKIINAPHLIKKGEVYNLGFGKQSSVGDIVAICKTLTGSVSNLISMDEFKRSYDTRKWVANMSKTKNAFGWMPKHNIENGLKKTIEWFKENKKLYVQNGK